MKNFFQKIRDFFRGYAEEDYESAMEKISSSEPKPGLVIKLTNQEFKALAKRKWQVVKEPILISNFERIEG